jgi:cysteine desulfurase / selenocysteine lyase
MAAIYLNNAATSFPKPESVVSAVSRWLREPPADPGRDATAVPDPLSACRAELAGLFGAQDPLQVALLPSATQALNLVLNAFLAPESHVIATMLEHTSVLRPIVHRERDRQVRSTLVRPEASGQVSPDVVAGAVRPETRLIVVTHASNVTGSIQPIEELAVVAAAAGVPLLIDTAQSAGTVPIDHRSLPGCVYIAFAGHKGLLGLPGTGGVVLAPDVELPQLVVGGTGVRSESLLHPPELPLRYEAGTPNLCGIAGLLAGVREVRARGVEREGAHRHGLVMRLRSGLERMSGMRVLPVANNDGRAGVLSFLVDGWTPEEIGYLLLQSFGITTRTGLHCAPLAHEVYGTAPLGTVRASVGWANTEDDVDALVEAMATLAGGAP